MQVFTGADVFDGFTLHKQAVLVVDKCRVQSVEKMAPKGAAILALPLPA